MTSCRPTAAALRSAVLLTAAAVWACGEATAPGPRQEPAVTILSPGDSAGVSVGVNDPVTFAGKATDPQDGALSGESLRWRSDRDGPLGTGREVRVGQLALGLHRITLIATDGDGNSAAATSRLEVERIVGPRLRVSPDTVSLTSREDSAVFRVTVLRAEGDTADPSEVAVRWSSGDTAVAVAGGGGVFHARDNGTVGVAARALGASDEAVLEVRDGWLMLAAGRRHTCGLSTDSVAYCWGANGEGQLGDGSRRRRSTPVPVAGGRRFAAIGAGDSHTCAVATDGALFCWGANGRGQLGTGGPGGSARPERLGEGRTFRSVAVGGDHACAIAADGESVCWGGGEFGQLGYGGFQDRLRPIRVAEQGFVAMAAGGFHTCGVGDRSMIACWGRNDRGQLGVGHTASRSRPSVQEEIRAYEGVAAGRFHACGLSGGGAALCWGANGDGQIGNGNRRRQLNPAGVRGGGRFRALSAGARHSCGVTTDGELLCWGDNRYGQVGDGSDRDRLSPTSVRLDGRFRSVAAGGRHTCAVTESWGAYCWGGNRRGQLGQGGTAGSRTPVPVPEPGG